MGRLKMLHWPAEKVQPCKIITATSGSRTTRSSYCIEFSLDSSMTQNTKGPQMPQSLIAENKEITRDRRLHAKPALI